MQLPELMHRLERYYGLPSGQLKERRRNKQSVEACDVFCYAAVRYLMYSGAKAGIKGLASMMGRSAELSFTSPWLADGALSTELTLSYLLREEPSCTLESTGVIAVT
ncbi:MAG: hypothetical protein OEM02_07635 [Desulfobulbaceae bacterium]|nr:hypothetical protein [Desulfobulbaceae bacterium]